MNEQFKKDLAKSVSNNPINQELTPGSTPRRWTPSGGVRKHNEKIHRESKYADDHKNLPFSFRKPPKPKGLPAFIKCDNCGHITAASKITVGMICSRCKKYSSVTEVEISNEATIKVIHYRDGVPLNDG